jgi:hypothetical protein
VLGAETRMRQSKTAQNNSKHGKDSIGKATLIGYPFGEYRTLRRQRCFSNPSSSGDRVDHSKALQRKTAQNNSNRGKDSNRRGAQYERKTRPLVKTDMSFRLHRAET